MSMDIADIGIMFGMLAPLYGIVIYYLSRTEHRITKIETRCRIFHGDDNSEG